MSLISDPARGEWLRARAGGWASPGGVAGTGFEAYARVLHPLRAYRQDLLADDGWGGHPIVTEQTWRWADVAARNGLRIHPLVQWVHLTGSEPPRAVEMADGWSVGPPEEGQLAPTVLATLTEHLASATATPADLVAAVWNGWGELNGSSSTAASFFVGDPTAEYLRAHQLQQEKEQRRRRMVADALRGPLFSWPDRDFHLMTASVDLFADPGWIDTASVDVYPASGRTPQMLWPEDHSWVLATEIDWDATIIAGSRNLIAAIVADDRFEGFEVHANDDLSWAGDTINHT